MEHISKYLDKWEKLTNMKTITITQKDIEKYNIQNSASGQLIDELAYSAGQWTEDDLFENNWEYGPHTPYNYDYEGDLFNKTKTLDALFALTNTLEVDTTEYPLNFDADLQAGAFMALNAPVLWLKLLKEYSQNLNDNGTDSISPDYNKKLQEEKDSYDKEQRKEWLYGDHRDYIGVIREIAKYYTEDRDAGSYNEKDGSYTLEVDEVQYKEDGYKVSEIKDALLDSIKSKGEARKMKDKADYKKRAEENKKTREYKAQRAKEEAEERRQKLLSMKITK